MSVSDYSQFSMIDLFRVEVENQSKVLTSGLLQLERNPTAAAELEALMRAAHSLKGAGRIVGLNSAVRVAHAMEDCFVAAQKGTIRLGQRQTDQLLLGVDLLSQIAQTPEAAIGTWEAERKEAIDSFLISLATLQTGADSPPAAPAPAPVAVAVAAQPAAPPPPPTPAPVREAIPVTASAPVVIPAPATRPARESETTMFKEPAREGADRVLRVTADNLNRLLGLAGESLVESRWLNPFAESLLRLKRLHYDLSKSLDNLRDRLPARELEGRTNDLLTDAQHRSVECRQYLASRLTELEMFDRRSANLSHRLYSEALACRMRPFADGIHGLPRMVRDVARSLGREARLEVVGESTQVDRDILEKLEAPLSHLLRNAVDHGLEAPETRRAAGKAPEGLVRLEARHSAGRLQITVTDDGRGVDLDALREAVVARNLTNAVTAAKMSETELLDFLFLPGFSMKSTVTEISGRGVGLDVVLNMIKQVRGSVRVTTQAGRGTRFQLQLPLTLSVMRALLADIGGEPYAFPLAHIARTLRLPREQIETLEGRQHFPFDGQQVGLVTAHQVLARGPAGPPPEALCVIVLGERERRFGVVVDRFLGERELVVQPLNPRLGKIKDISAGALMEDGAPALIIDVEDLTRSIEKLVSAGRLNRVPGDATEDAGRKRKRVLIVDDSLTVRELERKLLESRGFEVEVCVDGMDGWNAVRTGHYDLIISDVDMPRMDGIELVTLIKKDAKLKALPVMIVSYKDREEDRQRGLAAGADYYLTKGSFHDETLIDAVVDLIGDATG